MTNNENNIIYLSDYIQTSDTNENDIEYDNGNLELSLTSFDQIDEYLSSSDSYFKKINLLKDERNKIERMKQYLDASIHDFQYTDDYLYDMKNNQEEAKKSLKKEIPFAIGSTIASLLSSYGFYVSLDNMDAYGPIIHMVLLGTIAVLGTVLSYQNINNSINDYKEYKEYNKEINRYEKVLERTIK